MVINWEDRYLLGIERLDKQHKKLFTVARRILNILADDSNNRSQKQQFACQEGLKYLKIFLQEHFADEEAYMRSVDYKYYGAHKRLHDKMKDDLLPSIEKELEETSYSKESIQKFIGVFLAELISHVSTDDLAIVGRGPMHAPPAKIDRNLNSFANIVSDILTATFGDTFSAMLVDTNYAGGQVKQGIYYEYVYHYVTGEHMATFLVGIEETLLFHTCAMILGDESKQMNVLLYSLVAELSNIFFQRLVGKFIPATYEYKLECSNFIPHEQILEQLARKIPDISTLFETDYGKFAICAYLSS